ncbi:putative peptidase S54, rhomboid, Rhomboid-like superfamily [Dioscorea sansibarensis]
MGALEWDKVVHEHEIWRLITCIWLHEGVFHLFASMLSLVVIGILLEQQFGFVKIGILYLLSGFGGSVLSSLFIRSGISVGASGALFGLLGAILSELITNWTIYSNNVINYIGLKSLAAALLTLLVIIVLNLAIGLLPHVDNFAHILNRFFLRLCFVDTTSVWLDRPPHSYPRNSGQVQIQVVPMRLTYGCTAFPDLWEDRNSLCQWCRYLRCVPTSKWSCNY